MNDLTRDSLTSLVGWALEELSELHEALGRDDDPSALDAVLDLTGVIVAMMHVTRLDLGSTAWAALSKEFDDAQRARGRTDTDAFAHTFTAVRDYTATRPGPGSDTELADALANLLSARMAGPKDLALVGAADEALPRVLATKRAAATSARG